MGRREIGNIKMKWVNIDRGGRKGGVQVRISVGQRLPKEQRAAPAPVLKELQRAISAQNQSTVTSVFKDFD